MYFFERDIQWCRAKNALASLEDMHSSLCRFKREHDIMTKMIDMRDCTWSHTKETSGTAGIFLKTRKTVGGVERYFKASNFDSSRGFYGHESVLEIIAQRVIDCCGFNHLRYTLVPVLLIHNGRDYETAVTCSSDYRQKGERRLSLENFCDLFRADADSLSFLLNREHKSNILEMMCIDYIIYNRDRHGSNVEVLYNSSTNRYRMVPMFDHGCSLTQPLFDSWIEKSEDYYLADNPVNNYLGSSSLKENLITFCKGNIRLQYDILPFDILDGIDNYISTKHCIFLYNMLQARYRYAVEVLNS